MTSAMVARCLLQRLVPHDYKYCMQLNCSIRSAGLSRRSEATLVTRLKICSYKLSKWYTVSFRLQSLLWSLHRKPIRQVLWSINWLFVNNRPPAHYKGLFGRFWAANDPAHFKLPRSFRKDTWLKACARWFFKKAHIEKAKLKRSQNFKRVGQ